MKNINKKELKVSIEKSYNAKLSLCQSISQINKAIKILKNCISRKGKIFFCGNGGSAADAQHLTAELLVRLRPKINRKALPAICLSMDTSTLTACSNDYSFDEVFSRPFEALCNKNDTLIVLSTSGNSKNIINILKVAKKKKINSIAFLGFAGGNAKKLSTLPIIIKSNDVARVQEAHIFLGHFILENLENLILK